MFSTPSESVAEQTSQHRLRLRKTYGKRIKFLLMGTLLALVFIVGSAPYRGTDATPSIMTYVFAFLMVVCFVVAAYDKRVLFDRKAGTLVFEDLLAFVPVRTREQDLSDVQGVILTHFPLSGKSKKQKPRSLQSPPAGDALERPREFLKLYLETTDERILLEGSSIRTELENMGRTIAEFLRVNFTTQRI